MTDVAGAARIASSVWGSVALVAFVHLAGEVGARTKVLKLRQTLR
jgi:hypothetical protein